VAHRAYDAALNPQQSRSDFVRVNGINRPVTLFANDILTDTLAFNGNADASRPA